MRLRDILSLAAHNLRERPLRTALCALSVAVGSGALPVSYTHLLRACSKGFEDFKSNTDDVLQVLLDNQDEANFALDPDVEKKSCETLLPLMETEDAKFLSQTEQCWQENIDWMYDQGLIAEKPDVSDVMVNLDF